MGNETLLLKGAHKISLLWEPGQKQLFERSLGQTHLLIMESLLKGQEATGAQPGATDTGGSQFLGARSTTRTLVLARAILESSLELISAET